VYRVGDSSGVEAECLGQITGKLLKIVGHMDTTAKGPAVAGVDRHRMAQG